MTDRPVFEDEMTEDHLARTAEEYNRVTIGERHEERLARAQAYIRALEAQVELLRRTRQKAEIDAMQSSNWRPW